MTKDIDTEIKVPVHAVIDSTRGAFETLIKYRLSLNPDEVEIKSYAAVRLEGDLLVFRVRAQHVIGVDDASESGFKETIMDHWAFSSSLGTGHVS